MTSFFSENIVQPMHPGSIGHLPCACSLPSQMSGGNISQMLSKLVSSFLDQWQRWLEWVNNGGREIWENKDKWCRDICLIQEAAINMKQDFLNICYKIENKRQHVSAFLRLKHEMDAKYNLAFVTWNNCWHWCLKLFKTCGIII